MIFNIDIKDALVKTVGNKDFKLVFLLYRCRTNPHIKNEYIHVNASIGVFLDFMEDIKYNLTPKDTFDVKFPSNNQKVGICLFEFLDRNKIDDSIVLLIGVNIHDSY